MYPLSSYFSRIVLCVVWVMGLMAVPVMAIAQNHTEKTFVLFDHLAKSMRYDLKCLAQVTHYAPPTTSQAAQNPETYLPRNNLALKLRPNLHYMQKRLTLSLKPRLDADYLVEENSDGDQNEVEDIRLYVNEWLARAMLTDHLFVSYGRENLQWGGAYLFSPSNPFFTDNGRRNPKKEVEGMDFARLVLIPNMTWTLSFIAHTDDGEQDHGSAFETGYAAKIDYNAAEYYLSGIVAYRDDFGRRIGLYGGITCSDALLIYAEGALSDQAAMFYPLRSEAFSNNGGLADEFEGSSLNGSILIGTAYTLASGPTIAAEYLYSGLGATLDEQEAVLLPDRRSQDYTFFENGNYALLQYTHNDIAEVCDLVLRLTHGLDDHSGQFTAIVEYDLNDHLILYAIGTLNYGPADTEFGGQLAYHITLGLEYSF